MHDQQLLRSAPGAFRETDVDKSRFEPAGAPRYLVLAETLREQIMAGEPPVGELLPTEHALCDAYGVSRHTVRESLRLLAEAGLIARRRGAGTVVIASEPRTVYAQRLGAVDDVLQYPRDVRMEAVRSEITKPSSAVADRLGLQADTDYFRAMTVRQRPGSPPVGLSDLYILSEIAPSLDTLITLQSGVVDWVGREHGRPIKRINQSVSAVALSPDQAELLQAKAGDPGLRVVRRFLDEQGRVLGAADVVHPADRFTFEMTLAQEQARPQPPR